MRDVDGMPVITTNYGFAYCKLQYAIGCGTIELMRKLNGLKSQDVLILSKLLVQRDHEVTQKELSDLLHISQTEVSFGFERLKNCGLLDEDKKTVNRLAALEFFKHALKYLFPVEQGGLNRGVEIGPSFSFFKKKVVHGEDIAYVWPDSNGTHKGMTVVPFFKELVNASKNDQDLFHFLNVIEVLRGLGTVRHQKEAIKELDRIIK